MSIIERCRYCGAEGGDDFSFGPDDPSPNVCPRCLDERLAEVVAAALILADDMEPARVIQWTYGKLVDIGMTPAWADRFVTGDFLAVEQARRRVAG